MKPFSFILTLILWTMVSSAQITNGIEKYPRTYTAKMVDSLLLLQDYEKATWYIINLYGADSTLAKEKISKLKRKVKDLPKFIKVTFATYSMFDPDINDQSNGGMNINMGEMRRKGSWGDALIAYLQNE